METLLTTSPWCRLMTKMRADSLSRFFTGTWNPGMEQLHLTGSPRWTRWEETCDQVWVTGKRTTHSASETHHWVLLLEKQIRLSFTQFVIPAVYRRHPAASRGVISTVSNSLVSLSLLTTMFLSLETSTQAGNHGYPLPSDSSLSSAPSPAFHSPCSDPHQLLPRPLSGPPGWPSPFWLCLCPACPVTLVMHSFLDGPNLLFLPPENLCSLGRVSSFQKSSAIYFSLYT